MLSLTTSLKKIFWDHFSALWIITTIHLTVSLDGVLLSLHECRADSRTCTIKDQDEVIDTQKEFIIIQKNAVQTQENAIIKIQRIYLRFRTGHTLFVAAVSLPCSHFVACTLRRQLFRRGYSSSPAISSRGLSVAIHLVSGTLRRQPFCHGDNVCIIGNGIILR